jgi:hypothetical protein
VNWRGGIELPQSGNPAGGEQSALASAEFSGMLFGPDAADCHTMKSLIKPALLLAILAFCLFAYALARNCGLCLELEAISLQEQRLLALCLMVWCGYFIFMTFGSHDWPLIGLLIIAVAAYFISFTVRPTTDALMLLFGATLGKSAFVLLRRDEGGNNSETRIQNSESRIFLVGLILVLAFASWWHLDMANNLYHGPRWMGLWNNPNDYGLLMGAGLVLTIGLIAAKEHKEHKEKRKTESRKQKQTVSADGQDWRRFFPFFLLRKSAKSAEENVSGKAPSRTRGARVVPIILFIAAGMMAVGLLASYSRGAWVGTIVGLLYPAWSYGKLKWRWVLAPVFIVAAVAWFFWNNTPDSAPWYVKRLDLSRPSAQNRVAAWRGALQMMCDHPFGVGWNNALTIYSKNYSPPEGGAGAITTNDYLMLGTQLGWPGLICFVAYVGLCFRSSKSKVQSPKPAEEAEVRSQNEEVLLESEIVSRQDACAALDTGLWTLDSLHVACRAGALAMLVAFWFDGGLFKLATASVFWILLELGSKTQNQNSPVRIARQR